MVKITQATVKYSAGKVFQTQYGDRINAVVTLPDGEEIKLWGNPTDSTLTSLKKGQSVQLLQNSKGKWQLLETQEQTPQHSENRVVRNQQQQQIAWTPEEKRAIAQRVTEHAKLMKFCLAQAREHCREYLETSEDLRAIATTLFLSATRR